MKNVSKFKNPLLFISTLLAVVLLSSCSENSSQLRQDNSSTYENGEYKSLSSMLNQCKGLTVIVGIGEIDGSFDYAKINITVMDSTNTAYSCRIGGRLGLKIGDTLKVSLNYR